MCFAYGEKEKSRLSPPEKLFGRHQAAAIRLPSRAVSPHKVKGSFAFIGPGAHRNILQEVGRKGQRVQWGSPLKQRI
jgi:hypothetical protein